MDLDEELLSGPFTCFRAHQLGVTRRMLQGRRFVRVFPRVYRHHSHQMTESDWMAAARMTLPRSAQPTGITRIQQLGLEFGPRRPIRFVVEGDLHLVPPGIFLHRTKKLPPTDDQGVIPAAAFIAYCAKARVVDAIKVGDWLLHNNHMTAQQLESLALADVWRDGADEAIWILDHLNGRARSVKESETRAILEFAGLPRAGVNTVVPIDEDVELIGDLWLPAMADSGRVRRQASSRRSLAVPLRPRALRPSQEGGRPLRPGHPGETGAVQDVGGRGVP